MGSSSTPIPKAVLFDRDGTLVRDVPYNGDPGLVAPMPAARGALRELRRRGIATGVLSNQSGIARGFLTRGQVDGVNARIEAVLGPFDVWEICPHAPEDSCGCRKPAPGMILSACRRLGIAPAETAYLGDIGSDMGAAAAAGARGILVPTPITLREVVDAAPEVAADLSAAVTLLLGPVGAGSRP
jgi:HAD superfamily hydrolase (TIGR01662 family)